MPGYMKPTNKTKPVKKGTTTKREMKKKVEQTMLGRRLGTAPKKKSTMRKK